MTVSYSEQIKEGKRNVKFRRIGTLKNRFISNCLMLVASSSPVKFSRVVFR